ncbi:hypothetical protein RIF29_05907 [Crotalaria pallida]|uniref:Uncharacterized protein n=1 Tax=Crotalaria pallida TaxID=3830 RepID=A0AAN9J3L7_CROPI
MRSKGQRESLFMRMITSSIRALGKARDMYVRSITNCGHSMSYGSPTMQYGGGRFSNLPRSYSTATSTRSSEENEDFAELIRAASARTLGSRIDMDLLLRQQQQQQQQQKQQQLHSKGLPKSTSVGMAKIDEDMPFELSDGGVSFKPDSYPRSRSYAVGKRSAVF